LADVPPCHLVEFHPACQCCRGFFAVKLALYESQPDLR
jgi:hypothetical protein